jgi:uncharacterized protein YjbI with pentapeptide repeats
MTEEWVTVKRLVPFGAEHAKTVASDLVYPPKVKRGDLLWGFRLNSLDFISSYEYRWPFPGKWAEAEGPFSKSKEPCPSHPGDGICIAQTIQGSQSGGASISHSIGLVVAWLIEDQLAADENKVRVKRAWVAAVFDPVKALSRSLSANLGGADLGNANLGSANLGSANLRSADLGSANLYGANLRSANLYGANLYGANLRSADLYRALLGNANLRSADLCGANLHGADLCSANLRNADLGNANLYGANLRSADLGSANLYGALLGNANLGSANLYSANLYSANLHSANLYGADLRCANLGGADLGNANLGSAALGSATYTQLTIWPDGFDVTKSGAVLVT